MSNVTKVVKPRTSVLERTKQFESLSHPPQSPPSGKHSTEDSDSDDEGLDFAELVRNITIGNKATSGVSESDALQEAFKILDYDEDGFISVSDLRTTMKMFDNDDEDEENQASNKEQRAECNDEDDEDEAMLKEMIAEADFDGDGQISFDDFLNVLTKPDEPEIAETKEQGDKKSKEKHKKKHRKHPK